MSKTAIIAGATGLVGAEVLRLLLVNDTFDRVVALTRKPLSFQDPKLSNVITNFDDLESHLNELKGDVVLCCLGTTMKKAGTKEKFRLVDYEYPLQLAKLTRALGATHYLLISALGADPKSSVFYNRVKGEIEQAIGKVGFQTYHIVRPSLLMGPRQEERVGEDAAKTIFRLFGFLFVGPLKKYKAISYDRVARAMVSLATDSSRGKHIHESIQLQNY